MRLGDNHCHFDLEFVEFNQAVIVGDIGSELCSRFQNRWKLVAIVFPFSIKLDKMRSRKILSLNMSHLLIFQKTSLRKSILQSAS